MHGPQRTHNEGAGHGEDNPQPQRKHGTQLTHNEGAGCVQDIGEPQRTERDVGTLPVEREDHLQQTTGGIAEQVI